MDCADGLIFGDLEDLGGLMSVALLRRRSRPVSKDEGQGADGASNPALYLSYVEFEDLLHRVGQNLFLGRAERAMFEIGPVGKLLLCQLLQGLTNLSLTLQLRDPLFLASERRPLLLNDPCKNLFQFFELPSNAVLAY